MSVNKKIYILGICGSFTAQVAKLAIDLGYQVSGCDNNIYPPMSQVLKRLKIKVDIGYKLSHLKKNHYDSFIVGNAISRGNPILEHILEYKLPFFSASSWIKENVLCNRKVIAVSGTHGKTTTTAMIVHILKTAAIDCGFLIGGNVIGLDANAQLGSDKIFVIEADEYDSAFSEKYPKFMHYHPDILLINNLEFDHADIYNNLREIQTHFHYLIRTLAKNAKVIIPRNYQAIEEVLKRGFYSEKIDWAITDQKNKHHNAQLSAFCNDKQYKTVEISHQDKKANIHTEKLTWQNPSLASKHNIENGLAAILATINLGIPLKQAIKALEKFKGVERRMELKFKNSNIKIFDDFAHHPTSIQSTLIALKNNHPNQRLLVVFDPSSNTMKNGVHSPKTLAQSFKNSSQLYLYQPKNALIDTDQIAKIYSKLFNQNAKSFKDTNPMVQSIINQLNHFDAIIIFSNGSFNGFVNQLIESIKSTQVIE